MQFTTTSLSLALAATAVHAAAILSPRVLTNVAQVRLYSDAACGQDGNQGEWTVRNSTGELNFCNVLPALPAGGQYLSIVEQGATTDPAFAGCETIVYTDAACSLGATTLVLDVCVDVPAAGEAWESFEVQC